MVVVHNGTRNGGDSSSSSSSDNPFRKGAHVEVCFEEEGFRGSWYTATVLRRPPSPRKKTKSNPNPSNKILLEFHTLSSSSTPLRESVDLILVRPIPPRESLPRFHVGDDVDAFHNDGWWEGVVIEVLCCGYSVYFRSSREQIDFPLSHLRLHREWVHGKWVPPLQDQDQDEDDELDGVLYDDPPPPPAPAT